LKNFISINACLIFSPFHGRTQVCHKQLFFTYIHTNTNKTFFFVVVVDLNREEKKKKQTK
jgi:hypothetical protein